MNAPESWAEIITRGLPHFQIAAAPEQLSSGLLNHVWRVRGGPESIPDFNRTKSLCRRGVPTYSTCLRGRNTSVLLDFFYWERL